MRTDVLGIGFDSFTMNEAVSRALELINEHKAAYVVTPNPEIVMLCREDPELKKAVAEADMVLPDGIGIIMGAKILKTPIAERVPGIDFAQKLFGRLAERGGSVFLFGAKPGIAELAAEKLRFGYPGLEVRGTNDGYFTDDAPIIEKINSSCPDLLLVCLGAPKQELWMEKNRGRLNVGLMAGLGGCLDVLSGTVERAPESWRKLGLEWLYRLMKEPRRIGRMMNLPKFLIAVIKKRMGGKRA